MHKSKISKAQKDYITQNFKFTLLHSIPYYLNLYFEYF